MKPIKEVFVFGIRNKLVSVPPIKINNNCLKLSLWNVNCLTTYGGNFSKLNLSQYDNFRQLGEYIRGFKDTSIRFA